MDNKEKIKYIEDCICEKGYNLNCFKIEVVLGRTDVVWNIPNNPHLLCEYFRQKGIKIIPVKGSYGLTSLIFEADAFPHKFYEHVDNAPVLKDLKKELRKCDAEKSIEYLYDMYPTLVGATKEHYPNFDDKQIIEELIKLFKFDDVINQIDEDTYVVEVIIGVGNE